MYLSQRLEQIVAMAETGNTVADIGTDHGYVPIELVRRGRFQQALAMDVRKGPLERAAEHVREAGLQERIQLRLSNGLEMLKAGEADTVIIAGMGGPLMRSLLEAKPEVVRRCTGLVLSPQTEVGEFHKYILQNGLKVERECYVEDENKIYVVMRCSPGEEEMWDEIQLQYGKEPLGEGCPILRKKLERELQTMEKVAGQLSDAAGEAARWRQEELKLQADRIRTALARLGKE